MMEAKLLFIGSNPSQKSGSIEPFWHDTKSCNRLEEWKDAIFIKNDVYSSISIDCFNVSDLVTPNNRPLKISEIKAALPTLFLKLNPYILKNYKIIALGKTAEKALTLLHVKHFTMPHPSGLNRQLNDKKYVEEKIKELQNYLSSFKV